MRPLVRRFGLAELAQLIVVHDELDLPPGRMRVKVGGGTAGHNGLRSIAKQLGTPDFIRLRVGVGRPGRGDPRPDPSSGDLEQAEANRNRRDPDQTGET